MSELKKLGPTHGPSVSRFLNKYGIAGGWSAQSTHDGVLIHVSPYADAKVRLTLQQGGYVYTTMQDAHKRVSLRVTHRKI